MTTSKWIAEHGAEFAIPAEVLALVEAGRLFDLSWHNDVCPSFSNVKANDDDVKQDGALVLWVEHPNEDKRECGGARYGVTVMGDGWEVKDTIYNGDDLSLALKAMGTEPPPVENSGVIPTGKLSRVIAYLSTHPTLDDKSQQDALAIANEAIETLLAVPPDPEGTNDQSAAEAERVLFAFEETDGEAPYGGISAEQLTGLHEQNLSDLLCNFGHWCDRNGIDMQEVLRKAAMHYDAETDNKGVQFTVSN